MAVQDLTPQLRTRLSRVERAVGWFVILATLLLLTGFTYYVYQTAEHKGWFLLKVPYHTFIKSAAGLKIGDPVMLMGFPIGEITKITAMPPDSTYGNVYIEFIVREPFYGYIWTDSYLKLESAGFLGSRSIEVVKGGTTDATNLHASYKIDEKARKVLGVWNAHASNWVAYTKGSKGYGFTEAKETPLVTERLEELANQAQKALPGILDLTNQISRVLTNAAALTVHADDVMLQAQPVMTNLGLISSLITNGQGSLGDWLIPTNVNRQLALTLTTANSTLTTANTTLTAANTNVTRLALSLDKTLENLANITSNLNAQVQRNDQILSQISAAIVDSDQFVQGLKRHWFLRSAFKNTNQPVAPNKEPRARSAPAEPKTGKR